MHRPRPKRDSTRATGFCQYKRGKHVSSTRLIAVDLSKTIDNKEEKEHSEMEGELVDREKVFSVIKRPIDDKKENEPAQQDNEEMHRKEDDR